MTGFARQSGRKELKNVAFDWVWEIKSVNGKNLDIKTRLPIGWDTLASDLKAVAQRYFERGSLNICLELNSTIDDVQLNINRDLLQQALTVAIELYQKNPGVLQLPAPADLLRIPGVVDVKKTTLPEDEQQQLREALLAGFEECCAALQEDRRREGLKIKAVLAKMVDDIAALTDKVAVIAAKAPELLRQKLQQQIAELECNVPEERLAQEVVLLVNRADIREETDRLRAHIKTARQLLEADQTVGRRFDFLCQEFNREVNTTCSKAYDIEIINLGMNLKAVIEQLREQVQNME